MVKTKWLNKKWLVGLVAAGVALVGVGVAVPVLAQTQNTPPSVAASVNLDSPTLARMAAALGMTSSALSDQLKSGETLAQIAQTQNVPDSALVNAIVAPYADSLALQVKYGYMTQAQSQTLLQNAQNQATAMLQQNLSSAAANSDNNDDGWYGCWNFMEGIYGQGNGFGPMGPGMMYGWGGDNSGSYGPQAGQNYTGPGMMGNWGNYGGSSATTAPNPSSFTGSGGRGMMGRW